MIGQRNKMVSFMSTNPLSTLGLSTITITLLTNVLSELFQKTRVSIWNDEMIFSAIFRGIVSYPVAVNQRDQFSE